MFWEIFSVLGVILLFLLIANLRISKLSYAADEGRPLFLKDEPVRIIKRIPTPLEAPEVPEKPIIDFSELSKELNEISQETEESETEEAQETEFEFEEFKPVEIVRKLFSEGKTGLEIIERLRKHELSDEEINQVLDEAL